MANPMQMLFSSSLLFLTFLSSSTLADTISTVRTSSQDQVPCQICISCPNPCPVYYPPPPPVVVYPPPLPPPSPPPPTNVPQCPPPPPTCPGCPPCNGCPPNAIPMPPGNPEPRTPQPGVIGGTVYGPPTAAGGAVPYFPYYNTNPPVLPIITPISASTTINRKLWSACSAISLLLATLCFF